MTSQGLYAGTGGGGGVNSLDVRPAGTLVDFCLESNLGQERDDFNECGTKIRYARSTAGINPEFWTMVD